MEADAQTLVLHLPGEEAAEVNIELFQQALAAVDERGVDTEPVKNGGEFDRDIAAAHHQHAPRQFAQMERFVRADGEFGAGNRRHHRPAAGGDEDVTRTDAPAVHFHGVRVGEGGAAAQQRDPGAGKQLRIHPIQALDLAILVRDQCSPIERASRYAPAIARGMPDILAVVRRIGKKLLRDATGIDAGATEVALLGGGNARAEAGGVAARAHPARAGADGEKIVIVLRHGLDPRSGDRPIRP